MKTSILVMAASLTAAGFASPAAASPITTLYAFQNGADGSEPNELIEQGGILYGTTEESDECGQGGPCGTVFGINIGTGMETVLHGFTATTDGKRPVGRLIYESSTLYGTTSAGGANNDGTVFSVNPTSGAESILYSFAAGSDGSAPVSSLVSLNGLLYGTTEYGGDANCKCGILYSVNPATGTETVLYRFTGGTDGANPKGDLTVTGTTIYGTTYAGGTTSGNGTVFSFETTTNTEAVLYRFQGGADGAKPFGGVTPSGGLLYGTTSEGGQGCVPKKGSASGCGTVYSVNPATGIETVLYAPAGKNGPVSPAGSVTFLNNTLYANSAFGGTPCEKSPRAFCGTIFSVAVKTGKGKVMASFGGTNGEFPLGSMVTFNGSFYGSAGASGPGDSGTIFKFTP